jgi:hypothetical protein
LIWTTLSFSVIALLVNQATVVAQRPDGRAEGDEAVLALKTELEQAGRAWVKKYHEATSDEERAELERSSPAHYHCGGQQQTLAKVPEQH